MWQLTFAKILRWADQHHRRTGEWPRIASGPVWGGPSGLTWRKIDTALRLGRYGLPAKLGLPRLLQQQRDIPDRRGRQSRTRERRTPLRRPSLTEPLILSWADAYFQREGRWPILSSGSIPESTHDTWSTVNTALRLGLRGLPGGQSLFRLLHQHRGAPEPRGFRRNEERHRQVRELREQGLTMVEIGRRLGGISRQAIFECLRGKRKK